MSDRISEALKRLTDALIDEANEAVIKPILTGAAKQSFRDMLFGKEGIFSNPEAKSTPTTIKPDVSENKTSTSTAPKNARDMARLLLGEDKVALITLLKTTTNKTDQQIADFVNVSLEAVQLF